MFVLVASRSKMVANLMILMEIDLLPNDPDFRPENRPATADLPPNGSKSFGPTRCGSKSFYPHAVASRLPLLPHAFLVLDRKSTRLNSSHGYISYAVFCLKKKNQISTFLPWVLLFVPLIAILFQFYVPLFFQLLAYLDMPLLVTVYFSLLRRISVACTCMC